MNEMISEGLCDSTDVPLPPYSTLSMSFKDLPQSQSTEILTLPDH